MFMESLDGTILANALPSMAPDFGAAPVELKITITAYLIAVAVCIPVSGPLARRLGAVRLFQMAMALFALASLGCALSTGLFALTAARVVQGMAASMMLPVGRLLILRDIPKDQLVRAVAVLTWPALLAPIIAPLLGGLIVEHLTWHWIFLINVPIGLSAALLAPHVLSNPPSEPVARFDAVGFVIWAVSACLLVGGLGEAADLPGAATGGMAIAFAACAALLVRHLKCAPDSLFRLEPLRIGTFRHTIVGGSLVRIAIFANPLLLPLMFQVGLGLSPVDAGFLILLGMLGNLGMKPLTTPILQRFTYRTILVANGLLLSGGFALFALVGPATPRPVLVVLLVGTGMARSMHFTGLNTLAFREVPASQMSAANLLASSAQQVNAALGAAIGALAVEVWTILSGDAGQTDLPAFHFAFAGIAVLSLLGTLDALRLPHIRATAPAMDQETA
jgi:EmrB/QacA subfamily drug resistance transporter